MQCLLDKKMVAQMLKVSVRSVDYLRERGLPCHIIGGKLVRFDEDEVKQWALGHETEYNCHDQEEKRQD